MHHKFPLEILIYVTVHCTHDIYVVLERSNDFLSTQFQSWYRARWIETICQTSMYSRCMVIMNAHCTLNARLSAINAYVSNGQILLAPWIHCQLCEGYRKVSETSMNLFIKIMQLWRCPNPISQYRKNQNKNKEIGYPPVSSSCITDAAIMHERKSRSVVRTDIAALLRVTSAIGISFTIVNHEDRATNVINANLCNFYIRLSNRERENGRRLCPLFRKSRYVQKKWKWFVTLMWRKLQNGNMQKPKIDGFDLTQFISGYNLY